MFNKIGYKMKDLFVEDELNLNPIFFKIESEENIKKYKQLPVFYWNRIKLMNDIFRWSKLEVRWEILNSMAERMKNFQGFEIDFGFVHYEDMYN